ncbi:MAG: glycosyltransferase family 4 protein [Anaerolineales bacterium]|nr:glycosyltransferase family 4 protein [Anaerolineales bacterium]MCB8940129.1 glycosyltransferase family 4 protein [Ardenticatenaceae bacterium]
MRIGFDGTPLLGQRSGVGHYTGRLLAHLVQQQPEWEYWLFSNRPFDSLEAELACTLPMPNNFGLSRFIWMQLMLPRIIRHRQPDLCHFPNNTAPLCLERPSVITIHDASLFLHSQHHPPSRLLALRLLLPHVARRATAVITVSHHARQDLMRVLKLPAEKIHVIHEAAPAGFAPLDDPARRRQLQAKYKLPEQFVLFVGTIEPRKNLQRLIQAIAQLRQRGCDTRLVLVGPHGWLINGTLEKEIETLGLQDAVQNLGYVPQEDLPGIYSLATVFAFPSLYEGFGLPPLEAMACGTPVLTSRDSAMAEICGEAAWLTDPQRTEAIADGLARLLADADLCHHLRQLGLVRAQTYSWERTARETAVIYEKVLSGGAG